MGDDALALALLPLTDGVVSLRLPVEGDAQAIVAICDDPDVVRFTPSVPTPYGELDALAWLAVQAADVRDGRALHLAVDDVATGAYVATVTLFRVDRLAGEAEIGYLVHPAWRGRGVAQRAVRLLAAHAHGALGLHRLRLVTLPDNAASRLVALRCGFREEGVMRGAPWRGGARVDAVLYGHLAGDPLEPADPLRVDLLAHPASGVRLRLPRLSDVDALVAACQDPEIARFTDVPWPYAAGDAAAFVLLAADGAATGSDLPLAVVDPVDDELLGACGLHAIGARSASVGYWVAPGARGRGVASSALALVLEHAFDVIGLERLGAHVFDGNDASRRILERGGFVHEGILRGVPHHDGRVLDHHQYGITRSGWAGSRRA